MNVQQYGEMLKLQMGKGNCPPPAPVSIFLGVLQQEALLHPVLQPGQGSASVHTQNTCHTVPSRKKAFYTAMHGAYARDQADSEQSRFPR